MVFPMIFSLNSLNGTNGFVINEIRPSDAFGQSVSGIGDFNGDGFDDIVAGAQYANSVGQGYIFFGNKTFSPVLYVSMLDGNNGFIVNGLEAQPYDYFASAVSGAGDVNADGFVDIIIGATGASPNGMNNAGQAFVIFGKKGSYSSPFDSSSLNGANGFIVDGQNARDWSAKSVSDAGDINGDGIGDIIVGATQEGSQPGYSYVIFGNKGNFYSPLSPSSLNGKNGFVIEGITGTGSFGSSVSKAGDLNNDGIDDIIIGAPVVNNNIGQAYVIFGQKTTFPTPFNPLTLNGQNGFIINGIYQYGYLGSSVGYAGDINNDGIDDVIIGASGASPNGMNTAGQSYVIYGTKETFPAVLYISSLNGSNGLVIDGMNARDWFGTSVSGAGDINDDSIDDIIIGAVQEGNNKGNVYVIYGNEQGIVSPFSVSLLDGVNGFLINGIIPGGRFGQSVKAAGDVNGDGIGDVIASTFDASGQLLAQAYVIFGQSSSIIDSQEI